MSMEVDYVLGVCMPRVIISISVKCYVVSGAWGVLLDPCFCCRHGDMDIIQSMYTVGHKTCHSYVSWHIFNMVIIIIFVYL